jgi:hypothetical protein
MYFQKVLNRKTKKKFFFGVLKVSDEIAGSGSESGSRSISQRHGSADPDPHQNVMDPENCLPYIEKKAKRERGRGG